MGMTSWMYGTTRGITGWFRETDYGLTDRFGRSMGMLLTIRQLPDGGFEGIRHALRANKFHGPPMRARYYSTFERAEDRLLERLVASIKSAQTRRAKAATEREGECRP